MANEKKQRKIKEAPWVFKLTPEESRLLGELWNAQTRKRAGDYIFHYSSKIEYSEHQMGRGYTSA